MYSQCLIYLIFIIFINENRSNESIVLHIGALFDFEHPSIDHGRQDLQAAQLAIDDINIRYQDLFNGSYTLELLSNNSRVNIKIDFVIYIVDLLSVIQFMLLMLFFMQYFVVHKSFFLLEHHVQMKQKLLFKLLIITI
jgi:hypothetical protein